MSESNIYPDALPDRDDLPTRTAKTDLITAADHNIQNALLLDICETLGINPHGDADSLAARLASGFDALGYPLNPDQVKIVAKSGHKYNSIQAAIDAITDADSDNPYTIIVFPGIYRETVTLKDHVHLKGLGFTPWSENSLFNLSTAIFPTTGPAVKISTAGSYGIDSISLRSADDDLIASADQNFKFPYFYIRNCSLRNSGDSKYIFAFGIVPAARFDRCLLEASNNNKQLFNSESEDDNTYDLCFHNCFLNGHSLFSETADGGLLLSLVNTKVYGTIKSYSGNNIIKIHGSVINNPWGHALDINCGDMLNIFCHYSSVIAKSTSKSINIFGPNDEGFLHSSFSIFYPDVHVNICKETSGHHNIFGEPNTPTFFPF